MSARRNPYSARRQRFLRSTLRWAREHVDEHGSVDELAAALDAHDRERPVHGLAPDDRRGIIAWAAGSAWGDRDQPEQVDDAHLDDAQRAFLRDMRAAAAKRGVTVSRREIQRRVQCARTYPTEAQMRQVLAHFETWDDLHRANFPGYSARPRTSLLRTGGAPRCDGPRRPQAAWRRLGGIGGGWRRQGGDGGGPSQQNPGSALRAAARRRTRSAGRSSTASTPPATTSRRRRPNTSARTTRPRAGHHSRPARWSPTRQGSASTPR